MIKLRTIQTGKFVKASYQAALEIVPYVYTYIQPSSVADVGCGRGTWLKVFQDMGCKKVRGYDSAEIPVEELYIDPKDFRVIDLNHKNLNTERFDLVISLEVAEHLPEESAESYVDFLVSSGEVILFSASVPVCENNPLHLNEQWLSYWKEKFNQRGYEMVDCLRKEIWDKSGIQFWYKQTLVFFVERNKTSLFFDIQHERNTFMPDNVVHPEMYLRKIEEIKVLKNMLESLKTQPYGLKNSLRLLAHNIFRKLRQLCGYES